MQAIVIPKGQTSALLIVAILIVLLILAAGGYFAYRRGYLRTSSAAVPAPVSSSGFCPHCGQPTQAGARFCMSCGKEIPPR
ncbi:MAG: zinc-ribbon domain-containing protein [Chloroflexi bacterium]|nr:zinc-ribbon domain-containing protein [Chloroflexota bacterium]